MKNKILPLMGLVMLAQPAVAYLGGFEDEDGYKEWLGRVENYNAGQYGANVDPGASYSTITTNSGAWVKVQGESGVYASSHFGRDRLFPGTSINTGKRGLVITTNDDGWNGAPQIYDYKVDSHDLGGVAPTAAEEIVFSYWVCPTTLGGANNMDSPIFGDYVSLRDSSGNTGVFLGYHINNNSSGTASIAYNVNGTWVNTGVLAPTSYYQKWEITVNFANDKVSVDLIDGGYLKTSKSGSTSTVGTGNVTHLISDADLNESMDYLDTLRFTSSPGVGNAKQWLLDDFEFNATVVPEPSTSAFFVFGAFSFLMRRNRRSV